MSQLVDQNHLAKFLVTHDLTAHRDALIKACESSNANMHGRLPQWLKQLDDLPQVEPDIINLINGVNLGSHIFTQSQRDSLEQQLLEFSPWRKGPFDLLGVRIDAEWRSDLKWQRIADKLDLKDKRILDVGCGNGYYMFRMLGAGAKFVIGVDPVALFVIQFQVINKYLRTNQLTVLPVGFESLPVMSIFDIVFSMGVLYHRRAPLDHLSDLKKQLTTGGVLILETLVIETGDNTILIPEDRYAGMKNVWSIPVKPKLFDWLEQVGFDNIEVLDCSATTVDEQRQTSWMTTYSLAQFLNPKDHRLTIEGHPAPVRVMIKCSKQDG